MPLFCECFSNFYFDVLPICRHIVRIAHESVYECECNTWCNQQFPYYLCSDWSWWWWHITHCTGTALLCTSQHWDSTPAPVRWRPSVNNTTAATAGATDNSNLVLTLPESLASESGLSWYSTRLLLPFSLDSHHKLTHSHQHYQKRFEGMKWNICKGTKLLW